MLDFFLQSKIASSALCLVKSSLVVGLVFCPSVGALPDDDIQSAVQHIQQNVLATRAGFQEVTSFNGNVMEYRSSFPYRGAVVNVSIKPEELSWVSGLSESFWIDAPPMGSNLDNVDYNPRQDEAFLELISGIWGDAIANDFVSSRFTDRVEEEGRSSNAHRTSYKGERYGYTIRYMRGIPQITEPRVAFIIQSHEEWDAHRRLRNEYGGD